MKATPGTYRWEGDGSVLVLRVEPDGPGEVSGDLFAGDSWLGSFRSAWPSPELPDHAFVELSAFEGKRIFAATRSAAVRFDPDGIAVVTFEPPPTPRATYQCAYLHPMFRELELEVDREEGCVGFLEFDSNRDVEPAGSPAPFDGGVVTLEGAFARAGIKVTRSENAVESFTPTGLIGTDLLWSDAELNKAMWEHGEVAQRPQWKAYLLVASESTHNDCAGVMFDVYGKHRQGCAVFAQSIKWSVEGFGPGAVQRLLLFTCMHELGHCFNERHSWEQHPGGKGYRDLSWMNYPHLFGKQSQIGGNSDQFWEGFGYSFTPTELKRLHHEHYRSIVMGGAPFESEKHLLFERPLTPNAGLTLEIRPRKTYLLGDPIVVEFKLSGAAGQLVHRALHPYYRHLQIAIRTPAGLEHSYRPMIVRCGSGHAEPLLDARYTSVALGYGKDGLYFREPGRYRIRARYSAPDDTIIEAPSVETEIVPPKTAADAEVARLLLGEQQGQLMALWGSDARFLAEGNRDLQAVLDRHAAHPLAIYARFAKGINAVREFKNVVRDSTGKRIEWRRSRPDEAIELLRKIRDDDVTMDPDADNRGLNVVNRYLARAYVKAGRIEDAKQVLNELPTYFEDRLKRFKGKWKNLQDSVRTKIESEARAEWQNLGL